MELEAFDFVLIVPLSLVGYQLVTPAEKRHYRNVSTLAGERSRGTGHYPAIRSKLPPEAWRTVLSPEEGNGSLSDGALAGESAPCSGREPPASVTLKAYRLFRVRKSSP